VRKRLTAIARATSDVDSRRRKALVADLQAQHQAITGAIAAARGDVDAYMAQFDARQLSRPALAVLDGAAANLSEWQADAWSDARIAVLEALGQRGEAQQQRWASFCRCLSIHWPALPRAARYVLQEPTRWDGEAFDVLATAAERLSPSHPLAATILLRSMVVFALSSGRTKRYRYAAEHLQTCERLAADIDEWQGLESQSSFTGRLRERFGRCWSFWQLVER